jgi:hypothetical protein
MMFIIQVAAVPWAVTAVPETTLASQIFRKARFFRALSVEDFPFGMLLFAGR